MLQWMGSLGKIERGKWYQRLYNLLQSHGINAVKMRCQMKLD